MPPGSGRSTVTSCRAGLGWTPRVVFATLSMPTVPSQIRRPCNWNIPSPGISWRRIRMAIRTGLPWLCSDRLMGWVVAGSPP